MNIQETKKELRNKLLENKEGFTLEEILEKTEEIQTIWYQFLILLKKNIPYFFKYNQFLKIKICNMNSKNYFIMHMNQGEYLVIDIEKNKVVNKELASTIFDDDFFILNFNEKRTKYHFFVSCRNPKALIDFYLQHEKIVSKPFVSYYLLHYKESFAYFELNFLKNQFLFGIENKEKKLYEQFIFNKNFDLLNHMDTFNKNKVKELITFLKDLKIPASCIPYDLQEDCSIKTLKNHQLF